MLRGHCLPLRRVSVLVRVSRAGAFGVVVLGVVVVIVVVAVAVVVFS